MASTLTGEQRSDLNYYSWKLHANAEAAGRLTVFWDTRDAAQLLKDLRPLSQNLHIILEFYDDLIGELTAQQQAEEVEKHRADTKRRSRRAAKLTVA